MKIPLHHRNFSPFEIAPSGYDYNFVLSFGGRIEESPEKMMKNGEKSRKKPDFDQVAGKLAQPIRRQFSPCSMDTSPP